MLHTNPQLVPNPLGTAGIILAQQIFHRRILTAYELVADPAGTAFNMAMMVRGSLLGEIQKTMLNHVNDWNPHGQYVMRPQVTQEVLKVQYEHVNDWNPHPQYALKGQVPMLAPVQSVNGLTGAVVLDSGLPAIAYSTRILNEDFTMPADSGVVIPSDFEVASGFTLELGSNAILETT